MMFELFTRREGDVVARIVEGMANKEIAAELKCSTKTVEFHIRNIFRKTSVSSRLELACWFFRQKAAS